MKVYIAGKITGLPDLNRPRFERAKTLLTALGHDVVSPLDLDHSANTQQSWNGYMRVCVAKLCQVEAIALLDDWTDSKGARLEFNLSVQLQMTCLVIDKYEKSIVRIIEH